MEDKYGTYIQKLMSIILDKNQEIFVRDMAWKDLKKIGDGLVSFLNKNKISDASRNEEKQKQKQMLLFD
jgi:hypothetical protein